MENILEHRLKMVKPGVRTLFDMKDVIYDHGWLSRATNMELYYMYRELSLSKDDALIMKESDLRYDITIIPPYMLGCEYVKTAGHYHPVVPGTCATYPEIYEVLSGEAHYIMQKLSNDKVTDVIIIKAVQGDKVIIPPGYGHITVNASNKTLKMANWVAQCFESTYLPIKEKRGGAYFFLQKGLIKNCQYDDIPNIRILEPTSFRKIGIQKNKDMYDLVNDINKLEFLTRPHEYEWLFEEMDMERNSHCHI